MLRDGLSLIHILYALYDRNDLAAQACEELRRAGLAKQVYLTTFSDKTCIRK